MAQEADSGRHPIRSLIKLAVVVGVIYGIGRFLIQKKEEYADLTESEARRKLLDKLGPRLGDDTATEIADQVIPKLKERGLLRPDPFDEAAESVVEDE